MILHVSLKLLKFFWLPLRFVRCCTCLALPFSWGTSGVNLRMHGTFLRNVTSVIEALSPCFIYHNVFLLPEKSPQDCYKFGFRWLLLPMLLWTSPLKMHKTTLHSWPQREWNTEHSETAIWTRSIWPLQYILLKKNASFKVSGDNVEVFHASPQKMTLQCAEKRNLCCWGLERWFCGGEKRKYNDNVVLWPFLQGKQMQNDIRAMQKTL